MFSRFILRLLCFDPAILSSSFLPPTNGVFFLFLCLFPLSFRSVRRKKGKNEEDCVFLDLERWSLIDDRRPRDEETLFPVISPLSTATASAAVRRTVPRGSTMELRLTHFRGAVAASYNCDKLKTKSRQQLAVASLAALFAFVRCSLHFLLPLRASTSDRRSTKEAIHEMKWEDKST